MCITARVFYLKKELIAMDPKILTGFLISSLQSPPTP